VQCQYCSRESSCIKLAFSPQIEISRSKSNGYTKTCNYQRHSIGNVVSKKYRLEKGSTKNCHNADLKSAANNKSTVVARIMERVAARRTLRAVEDAP